MMPKDIKTSFDKVQTDAGQRAALLEGIRMRAKAAPSPKPVWRRAVISAAACCLLLVTALLVWVLPSGGFSGLFRQEEGSRNNLPPDMTEDNRGEQDDIGDMLLYTQFGIKGRQYLPLSEDKAAELGLTLTVSPDDVGERIADIQNASDPKLVGGAVWRYKKIPGEAIVAAEIDGAVQLFYFFMFDKYGENADEDTIAYLELYGIESGADIAKIEFIRYTEEAKLDNRLNVVGRIEQKDELEAFYNHYSVIRDSSAAYFEKLFGESGGNENGGRTPEQSGQIDQAPPDAPADDLPAKNDAPDKAQTTDAEDTPAYAEDMPAYADDTPADGGREPYYDEGESASGTPGSIGLLTNQVTVRIYAQSGLFFDTVYYPDMGFISRHEVSAAFSEFLAKYTGETPASSPPEETVSIIGEWVYTKSTEGETPVDIHEFADVPPTIEISGTPKAMLSFEGIVLSGTIRASFYESTRVGTLQQPEGQSYRITGLSMLAEGDILRLEEDEFLQYDPVSGLLRYDLSGTDVQHFFARADA